MKASYSWETDITLLSNPLFVKQLILVAVGAGSIMAFILVFIFAITGEFEAIPLILLISFLSIVGLAVSLVLITIIAFGNKTRVRFKVDRSGATWETVDKRAKRAGRLAILAGILGQSAQAAGAGTLAVARENEFVAWSQLAQVEYDHKRLIITLRNSWRPLIMMVCQPENYDAIKAYVDGMIKPSAEENIPSRKPLRRALLRTLFVCLAIAPLFHLSSLYIFDFDLLLPIMIFAFVLATVWLIPLFGWVVLACLAIVLLLLIIAAVDSFSLLNANEQFVILLALIGIAFLARFSWLAVKGKIIPPLLED